MAKASSLGRPRWHLYQPESARVSFSEPVQRACDFETVWRPQALLDLDRTTWRRSLSGEIVRELATEGKLAYTTRSDIDLRVRWVRLMDPPAELRKLVSDVQSDRQRLLDERKAAEAAAARVKREKRHDELCRNLEWVFRNLQERKQRPNHQLFWWTDTWCDHPEALAELVRDFPSSSFAQRLVALLREALADESQMIHDDTRLDIEAMLTAVDSANGTL